MLGKIKFRIAGQEARPKWEQNLLRKALENGAGADQALRFQCRIAQDARRVFGEFTDDTGETYTLNPKAAPQFGRNERSLAYLTVGLIRESDGKRVRLTWEGDAVPRKMQEVAVKHDEGKRVGAATVALDLAAAKVLTKSSESSTTPAQKRRYEEREKAKNGGLPRTTVRRRNHGRLCAADLVVSE